MDKMADGRKLHRKWFVLLHAVLGECGMCAEMPEEWKDWNKL
jgi:hypothetical protein